MGLRKTVLSNKTNTDRWSKDTNRKIVIPPERKKNEEEIEPKSALIWTWGNIFALIECWMRSFATQKFERKVFRGQEKKKICTYKLKKQYYVFQGGDVSIS